MSEQKLREALQELRSIRSSSLCDPECEGRCKVCPLDAVQNAIKHLEALSQPPTSDEGTPLTDQHLRDLEQKADRKNMDTHECWLETLEFARQLERTLHAKERELAGALRGEQALRDLMRFIDVRLNECGIPENENGYTHATNNRVEMLIAKYTTLQSVSAAPQGEADATSSRVWDEHRCKDGGLCGVGGFCKECPYVRVPRKPTQAMLDAGYWPCVQGRGAKSVWAEMLAAAPQSDKK